MAKTREQLERENEELRREVRAAAEQMDKWAIESRSGGWSTHQVEPQRNYAMRLYVLLGRLGS